MRTAGAVMVGRGADGVKRGVLAAYPGNGAFRQGPAGVPADCPRMAATLGFRAMADTLQTGMRGRPPTGPWPRSFAWAALVALGLVSVGGWALYRGSHVVSADPVAIVTAVDATLPSHAGATIDRPRSSRIESAPVAIVAPDIRARFEASADLYGYVQSLEAAAQDDDGDAIWMISRAYDYCSAFATSPAAYDRDTRAIQDMGMRGSRPMVVARERVSQRCARFMPQDDLSPRMIVVKRMEAAQAGSLAAEAALMAQGQPLQPTTEYQRDLVQRVKDSNDPEAYSALSPGMGIAASGRAELADQVAGTQFAELSWQLAACRLGMDCGPESTLMTSYCANGGICSRDPHQDFERFVFDAAVPRQGADVINEMIDSLMGEKRTRK